MVKLRKMFRKLFLSAAVVTALIFFGCKHNTERKDKADNTAVSKIILETDRYDGGMLKLAFDAPVKDRGGVWLDLNNNGIKDEGEAVTAFSDFKAGTVAEEYYTAESKIVTVYGKIAGLKCGGNEIIFLDITGNPDLSYLECSGNLLKSLDVSSSVLLTYLICSNNNMEKEAINGMFNGLKDWSGAPEVNAFFNIKNNPGTPQADMDIALQKGWKTNTEEVLPKITFTTLVEKGKEVKLIIGALEDDKQDVWIDLNGNGKKESGEEKVRFLIPGSQVQIPTKYTIQNQTITVYGKVTHFGCDDNKITSVDVSQNVFLRLLDCNDNLLETLDVSSLKDLVDLSCNGNRLKTLDVRQNKNLLGLGCGQNPIEQLSLTANKKLELLSCDEAKLTELDLSENTFLNSIICSKNLFTKEALDKIFGMLKVQTTPDYATIIISYNPGSKEADISIAKNKGWRVINID